MSIPTSEPIRTLTLFDNRTDTDHSTLTATINEKGDLVLEGFDIGELVKAYWGDSDYEYARTVAAAYTPAVLLWLIKERFATDSEFKAWLDAKGIPSEFWSYI